MIEYTWTAVAGVYLLDNQLLIGHNALLALPSGGANAQPRLHIDADQVQITFPTINSLKVCWRQGVPIASGTIIYTGAYLVIEKIAAVDTARIENQPC